MCCHGNATRAPSANPPNSAELGGIPSHSAKLHQGPCNSVGMRPQTDTQTRVTTIHFASSTIHAKCNKSSEHSIACLMKHRGKVNVLAHYFSKVIINGQTKQWYLRTHAMPTKMMTRHTATPMTVMAMITRTDQHTHKTKNVT